MNKEIVNIIYKYIYNKCNVCLNKANNTDAYGKYFCTNCELVKCSVGCGNIIDLYCDNDSYFKYIGAKPVCYECTEYGFKFYE